MGEKTVIAPIAHIQSDFTSKFGIPRQSGLVEDLTARVVLKPEYRQKEAFRCLEGFSHIWLIWQFSKCKGSPWHATVRPPRLGGNVRVGVFASRSPFRPNNLGLSCVRLDRIDYSSDDSPALIIKGADIMDGTPVFDIKPYIPVSDCVADASEGYTAETRAHSLNVSFPPDLLSLLPENKRQALIGVLESDPRPGYENEPEREYGMCFAGYNILFFVDGNMLRVADVKKVRDEADMGQNC